MRFLTVLFVFFILGCTSEKEEVVDFQSIAPTSDKYKDGFEKKEIVDSTPAKPLKSDFLTCADSLWPQAQWRKWDTLLFPDRFGPKMVEKWHLITSTDSLVLLSYRFTDSLRTKNAFFNWLDCFGPKCRTYSLGSNIHYAARNTLLFVGANQLVLVESNKKISEEILRMLWQEKLEEQNWIYILDMPKGKKSTWKRIVKGEEQAII